MKMKKTCLLVLALCLALVLSGCNRQKSGSDAQSSGSITIRLTEQESQNSAEALAYMQKYIAEARQRGIVIEHTTTGGDEMRTKVKAEFATGNPPDIFYWNVGSNLKELIDGGVLVEVNDFFKNSKTLKKEMWSDGGWANVTLDGGRTHWGFPITTQWTALIANKKLFQQYGLQYPKTYEDLKEVAKVFRQNGIFAYGVGSKIGNPSHFTFDTILHQFVPLDYTVGFFDGSSKFDVPEVHKAGHYVQDMQRNNVMTSDSIAYGDWTITVEMFNTEKSAMMTLHPWIVNSINTDIDFEIIDWWNFPDTMIDPNSFYIGGTNAAICISRAKYNESDRRKEVIQEIVETYLNDEMLQLMVKGGIVAPRSSYPFDLYGQMDPMTSAVYKHLEGQTGVFFAWGNMPNGAVAASYTLEFTDSLWACSDTPENLAKQLQAAMDEVY
jgi:ABC-type glycerol-3-phosphate transport system substrate-binding protein